MRLISTILRIIANIFLFCLYSIVSIVIENFIFGLIMVNMWKTVPWTDDPIHMALAIATTWCIALITFIFRKVFYISVCLHNEENNKSEVMEHKVVVNTKSTSTKNDSFDEEIKIYIDKEIK